MAVNVEKRPIGVLDHDIGPAQAPDTWPESNGLPATAPQQGALSPAPASVPQPYASPQQPYPVPSFNPTMVQQTAVNVNVGMPNVHFHAAKQGHGFVVRALWFLGIGWWLSALAIIGGYLLVASLIFLPAGLWLLHRVPQAQTLRVRTREFTTGFHDGAMHITEGTVRQVAWYKRLLYLPVGLTAGLVWLTAAWGLGILVLTLPLSIWMVDRAPGVITLQRH